MGSAGLGEAQNVHNCTAILVDEDPDTIVRVKDALQQHDCVVALASTSTVVAAAHAHKGALVLLAPSSSDPDPWSACRKLHDNADNHHVICLLDRYDPAVVTAAFAAGAEDVLSKPLIPAELEARVRLGKRMLVLEETRSTLEEEGALLAEISTRASFHSRRYLQSELTNELTRARRFAHALAVIVARARAPEGGERAMRSFGQVLSRLCRSRVDWIARHGDRSYAVVLPETDLVGALSAAGRLQTELSARETSDLQDSLVINLGVSAVHGDNASFAEDAGPQLLLEAAEQYLQEAMNKGPGQIVGGPAPHA
jgi:PleD family two-component response regulator